MRSARCRWCLTTGPATKGLRRIWPAAPTHRAFLLANHGPVVTGKDLRAAADNTEEMEDAARLIFTLGDRPIRYLTDDEIAELRS